MTAPLYTPGDYTRVTVVHDPDSLGTHFKAKSYANCRVMPRPLPAGLDFNALACALADMPVREDAFKRPMLERLAPRLPAPARAALDFVIEDMNTFPYFNLQLRVIARDDYYPRTVFNFHADGAGGARYGFGRLCCVYNGAVTEGLRNDMARSAYDSRNAWVYMLRNLKKNQLGLLPAAMQTTYFPTDRAGIFTFGTGDLWHQKSAEPGARHPFIHRAPPGPLPRRADDPSRTVPRLLLT